MNIFQNVVYAIRYDRFKRRYKFTLVTSKGKSHRYIVTKGPYEKLRLPKFVWDRLR